jgi:hypothetical protein
MTTFEARSWAHVAQRATKPRDTSRIRQGARTALGFALLAALLAAGLAIRVLVFVHF